MDIGENNGSPPERHTGSPAWRPARGRGDARSKLSLPALAPRLLALPQFRGSVASALQSAPQGDRPCSKSHTQALMPVSQRWSARHDTFLLPHLQRLGLAPQSSPGRHALKQAPPAQGGGGGGVGGR